METNDRLRRREVLKSTSGIIGGLTLGGTLTTSVAAQSTYYRYDRMRVQLLDVESTPARPLSIETSLYLTQPFLNECHTDHPCSIDVLAYRSNGDWDDDDDDRDGNEPCPGFASLILFCYGGSGFDHLVMTGLIPDVLDEDEQHDGDFVFRLKPTDATNVDTPEQVSNPCPATSDGQDEGEDDDDRDDDDDGRDDDDTGDDQGDDDQDDNGNDDDQADNDDGNRDDDDGDDRDDDDQDDNGNDDDDRDDDN